ncbi:glycoside hydrolase family 32 protein [Natronococcus pandeyae]|uniref:glycoside hydrolase family 32 protein n=1 Tax=Natronococcus pandeyae TaxID=2055836 RepID=UPI00165324C8|nr:glycoside hydrolase family 32 protein [Natronococcus pandeyae]
METFRRQREQLSGDPYRPAYHFSPPGGIVHDPNGACYWNGRYHLFYQFRPPDLPEDVPWVEAMHWGHAVSEDLVHWQDLPIALSPDTGAEKSCYSGQALVEDDRVVFMYHGPGSGNCIATADDPLLVDVEKSADNPVISEAGGDDPFTVFDPEIWRSSDGSYYSLSGTHSGEQFVDSEPAVYLFRSDDLTNWEYVGPFFEDGSHTDPGEDAAVPNFLEIDGRHVLLCFSHRRGAHYFVGDYDRSAHRFEPERHGRLTHGPTTHDGYIGDPNPGNLHAPSVLDGPEDRQIAFFNLNAGAMLDGWGEVVSLPRELGLSDDGTLTVAPVDELERLRCDHRSAGEQTIPSNDELLFDDDAGRALEISATIDPKDAGRVGLTVLRSPEREEVTEVTYYPHVDCLGIDATRSSTRSDATVRPAEEGPLRLEDDEPLELRVFVDRSIVEVFANGRRSLAARAYPGRSDSTGLSFFARGGEARLRSLDVWEMASIW